LTLINIGNVGCTCRSASPHLPREVAFALAPANIRNGTPTRRFILKDADPRRWAPEAGLITLRGEIPVPIDAPPDKWQLMIQLADPSPKLRDDGRYAIRLANKDIEFIEATGWNILADDIALD
jgi:hypothetical protein